MSHPSEIEQAQISLLDSQSKNDIYKAVGVLIKDGRETHKDAFFAAALAHIETDEVSLAYYILEKSGVCKHAAFEIPDQSTLASPERYKVKKNLNEWKWICQNCADENTNLGRFCVKKEKALSKSASWFGL